MLHGPSVNPRVLGTAERRDIYGRFTSANGSISGALGMGFTVARSGEGVYTVTLVGTTREILHVSAQVHQDDADNGILWCVDPDFTTSAFVIRTFNVAKAAADVIGKVSFHVHCREGSSDPV